MEGGIYPPFILDPILEAELRLQPHDLRLDRGDFFLRVARLQPRQLGLVAARPRARRPNELVRVRRRRPERLQDLQLAPLLRERFARLGAAEPCPQQWRDKGQQKEGWGASCYTHTASGHRRLARQPRPAARAAAPRPVRGARRTAEGWRAESCRSRPRVCGPGPAPRTAAALALDEATAKGQAPLLLTKLHGLPYRSSGWSGQQGRCRGCGFPILESGPSPSCSGRRAVGNNDMSWAWHGNEQHEKQQRLGPNLVAGLGLLAACERNALAKLRLLVIRELRLRLVHVFIVKLHEADSESRCQS